MSIVAVGLPLVCSILRDFIFPCFVYCIPCILSIFTGTHHSIWMLALIAESGHLIRTGISYWLLFTVRLGRFGCALVELACCSSLMAAKVTALHSISTYSFCLSSNLLYVYITSVLADNYIHHTVLLNRN